MNKILEVTKMLKSTLGIPLKILFRDTIFFRK
nr:MAG TPA: hypothetical protein [Caudoviricetes sp.]